MQKKFLFIIIWMVYFLPSSFAQDTQTLVKTIKECVAKMPVKEEYTKTISVKDYPKIRKEWDAFLIEHNKGIEAWNKVPKQDYTNPDVKTAATDLSARISYFKQWTAQMVVTEEQMKKNNTSVASNTALSESSKVKILKVKELLNAIQGYETFNKTLQTPDYVPASQWYLLNKGKFNQAVDLWNGLSGAEKANAEAIPLQKKLLEVQATMQSLEKQFKTISQQQLKAGLWKSWRQDTEKYKESVLTFADVLGVSLPQNTTNSTTLYELKADNYDKVLKDLEELSELMSGKYKDLIDDFTDFFPALDKSPNVYRMVSVNRKKILPDVVKLSAKRFLDGTISGAPNAEDLEKEQGWIDAAFSPQESKKTLAEVKSRFLPVLQKSGVSESEVGLNQLDKVYEGFWKKAEELAPKWKFPPEASAAGDARARTLFTSEIKKWYPKAQILKMGFAYDAKWTVYMDGKTPKYRTIGTTALIKHPEDKYPVAWQLLFNENYVGGGKFSGGSIQWIKWRWQANQ